MNRFICLPLAILLSAFFSSAGFAQLSGNDVLNDTIGLSGATLNLRRYVADIDGGTGRAELISMTTQPGSTDLFVVVQTGLVFSVADNGAGLGIANEWFNYNAAINTARDFASNGYALEDPTNAHGGLRSVAFHPEFETNGKFYTSAMVDRPLFIVGQPGDFNYIGVDNAGFDGESLVAEWTYDFNAGEVDASSYRELFRVSMPIFDHPIKQMAFNNFAVPGDEDYGLLYIAHGDGSDQSAVAGGGQNRDDGLAKSSA